MTEVKQEEQKFPTDLIWAIATTQNTKAKHTPGEVTNIVSKMYPGINFWWSQLPGLVVDVAKKT